MLLICNLVPHPIVAFRAAECASFTVRGAFHAPRQRRRARICRASSVEKRDRIRDKNVRKLLRERREKTKETKGGRKKWKKKETNRRKIEKRRGEEKKGLGRFEPRHFYRERTLSNAAVVLARTHVSLVVLGVIRSQSSKPGKFADAESCARRTPGCKRHSVGSRVSMSSASSVEG